MTRERINIRLTENGRGDWSDDKLYRILFNEPVNFQIGDEIEIVSYMGMGGMNTFDAFLIRKDDDAKEGKDIS